MSAISSSESLALHTLARGYVSGGGKSKGTYPYEEDKVSGKTYHHMIPESVLKAVWNSALYWARSEADTALSDKDFCRTLTFPAWEQKRADAQLFIRSHTPLAEKTAPIFRFLDTYPQAMRSEGAQKKILRQQYKSNREFLTSASHSLHALEASGERSLNFTFARRSGVYRNFLSTLMNFYLPQECRPLQVDDLLSWENLPETFIDKKDQYICWPKWNLVIGPAPSQRTDDPGANMDRWSVEGKPPQIAQQISCVNSLMKSYEMLINSPPLHHSLHPDITIHHSTPSAIHLLESSLLEAQSINLHTMVAINDEGVMWNASGSLFTKQ